MVGQPVLYLGQADVEGIDVPSGDFHDVSVCAVGWEAADSACGHGRYCIADWFIFRYGLKGAGRLKADVSDGLVVVMWNNLFIRLGL